MVEPDPLRDARVLVAHPGAEMYGSDRVMLETVAALVRRGAAVAVTVPDPGPLTAAIENAGAHVIPAPAFVLRKRLLKPSGWGELISGIWHGARAARRLLRVQRPALVYVSTTTLPLWPLMARWRRIPTVLHVHEGEASTRRIVRRVLYLPGLLSTRILVNSRFTLSVMTSAWARLAVKTAVVLNPVAGPSRVVSPRKVLEGPLRVLYIGRLSPRKGVDVIVEAVRLLAHDGKPVELEVLGSTFNGYEWYEDQLHSAIASADLTDRIRLSGFTADVWPALESCDVLVVPSRQDESFGNTVVEGVLAARTVIVSLVPGLAEASDGFASVLQVRRDDAESLRRALEDVEHEWARLRRAALASAPVARERHSVDVYRERVTQELAGVLSSRG